jgi:hypothetical protein
MTHLRQHREDREERTSEMGVHRILVLRQLHVLERTNLDHAGVVDQHVDGAVAADRMRDSALDIVARADVGRCDQNVSRLPSLDIVCGSPEFALIASDQRDARPRPRADVRARVPDRATRQLSRQTCR